MLHGIGGAACYLQSTVNARHWLTNYRAAHDRSPAGSFRLCRLGHYLQRAHQSAFGQFDFEGIVMQRLGIAQRGLSRSAKLLLVGLTTFEHLLGLEGAPG